MSNTAPPPADVEFDHEYEFILDSDTVEVMMSKHNMSYSNASDIK